MAHLLAKPWRFGHAHDDRLATAPRCYSGQPEWPIPEKLPEKEFTTYIYRDEVVVLVPLKLASDLSSSVVDLKANVSWLECEVQCIPGHASVQASLKIGAAAQPSQAAELIAAWQRKLPKTSDNLAARAWWEKAAGCRPASGPDRMELRNRR
jgi:DsbC/DsbD-like thiol-disulfide interchange protein